MKKQLAVLMLVTVLLSTFLFVGNVSAIQKNFTSTINPATTYTGQSRSYAINISDYLFNPSGNKLGSVSISIPSEFTSIQITSFSTSSGATWNLAQSNSAMIKLTASSSANCISPGQSIILSFTATAPPKAGTYAWNTTAYTNPGWSGDLFSLRGSQPSVSVTQEVFITFAYQVNDNSLSPGPLVHYQHFGDSSLSVTATADGAKVSADAGSFWYYVNPITASSNNERWIAATSGISGSVPSTDATFSPFYYHQFQVSASYSTSDGTTPPSPVKLTGISMGASSQTEMPPTEPIWLDANTAWSINNPIPTLYTNEKWEATTGTSGTLTSPINIAPLFYHQYKVSFALNPSSRAGSTSPSGTTNWITAGSGLPISEISYFGYTFSSWTTDTESITIAASSTSPSTAIATINGPGTITASFASNNGHATVQQSTTEEIVYPVSDVCIGFANGATTGGDASADTTTPIPSPPSTGFFQPGSVWSITTTAGFPGDVTIGIVVNLNLLPTGTNPAALRIWQADFALGDVNFDGKVNSKDTTLINKAYGTTPSSGSKWNPVYDLNHDGIVDSLDVTICTHNYGETTTAWTELPSPQAPMQIGDINSPYWVIYGSTDHFSGFGVH